MIESIHQSSLNTALRCGEQFRRRYIEGEIRPPGIAAARGTGVHGANEANLKQKVITEKDLSLDDLKDAARDKYVHQLKRGVFIAKEDLPFKNSILNDGLNQTLKCTEVYRENVAPKIQPVEVERRFSIDVGLSLPLVGMIDIERDGKIDDLKTSGKKWSDDAINKEIQPIFYSLVHRHETGIDPIFYYHILKITKAGNTGYQELNIKATDRHYRALFAKLVMFEKMLKSGTFLPANPTSWWCSKNWCGYWQTCVYVGNDKGGKWI